MSMLLMTVCPVIRLKIHSSRILRSDVAGEMTEGVETRCHDQQPDAVPSLGYLWVEICLGPALLQI